MNRQNLILIACALILLVIFSGCAKKDAAKYASDFPGLIITKFISDQSEIDAGERTTIEVDYENVGEQKATGIKGILIRKGSFVVDPAGEQTATDLDPPVEETPSGDAFLWHLTAPTVTSDRMEEVQARISYNYETQGFGTINFVPRDILREKGESAFLIDSSSTLGPLEISTVANQPYVIRDKTATTASMRVIFAIANVGPGTVESSITSPLGDCDKGLNCIDEVIVTGYGPSCIDSTTGVVLAKTYKGVRLVKGEEATITDTYSLKVADPNAATSCQLRATAKYRYRIDSDILSIGIKAI